MSVRLLRLLALALLLALPGEGCSDSDEEPDKGPVCSSQASAALEPVAPETLSIHLDMAPDAAREILKADLEALLSKAWGLPALEVQLGAPALGGNAVWITSSEAARTELGVSLDSGYALRRIDSADGARFVVYAPDAQNLAYASYAFLEQLGFRFFHPKQDLVPELGKPVLPRSLDVVRRPAFRIRGIQPHILHPIEWLAPLAEPGADNLADAKRLIDWLMKTGQNLVQWPLLDYAAFSDYAPHAGGIAEYAHSRGARVGAVVQMFEASAHQNNYVLIADETNWQLELEAGIDQLMTVGWDSVALALGEFVGNDPTAVIGWLNHATQYFADHYPNVEVSVQVHVGNYPGLWIDYAGQKTFFYHLAGETDPRLASSVHTVFFFDLYRDWGTYKHDNFFWQRDYLFRELPERRVEYFPESAYWIAGDIDVPQFLPEYIYSRWLDVSSLTRDIAEQGLPALDGHIVFSSGHEWGYWLTDYLAARMAWEPAASFEDTIAHFSSAFGPCGAELGHDLAELVKLQNEYLFDKRLIGYVSGEDNLLDVGWLAGYESHPRRRSYEEIAALEPDAQAAFEQEVVVALENMAAAIEPLEKSVAARCATADAALESWCDELHDGFAIDRLRARHAASLYRAVLDWSRGGSESATWLERAAAEAEQAEQVVTRRALGFRFDPARLVEVYDNRTVYEFGYLRQAHTLCFWRRQAEQARILIESGYPAGVTALSTCHD